MSIRAIKDEIIRLRESVKRKDRKRVRALRAELTRLILAGRPLDTRRSQTKV